MSSDNTESPLTLEQRQRGAALTVARSVLAERGFASSGSVDAIDLVNVAEWIITGEDPWELPVALDRLRSEAVADVD